MKIEQWPGLTSYHVALARMDAAVADVIAGGEERVFICQHEPVFTVGTSGDAAREVLAAGGVPVIETGRGGKVTYHGPGQIVVYPILDLGKRGKDLRAYVKALQEVVVAVLAEFGVAGQLTDDVGVWVANGTAGLRDYGTTDWRKIAAVGVRVRKWVTFHGFALNVDPDLAMFERIIPCGIADKGVTSLAELGVEADFAAVEAVVERACQERLRTAP